MPTAGNPLTILNSIDSSNNYAMQRIHAGMAGHGQAILALEQTAGKGQRGKDWKAKAGENILMSTILETAKLSIDQQFRLSAAVAVAVRRFFAAYAVENVFVKWPNDLYVGDRKAGGILIENVLGIQTPVEPQEAVAAKTVWKWAIVGTGININQAEFPSHLPNATSLRKITGKMYDVELLANHLADEIRQIFSLLLNDDGWKDIFTEYNQFLYKRGLPVRLRKNNVVIPCTIRGVAENGRLLIMEDETVGFDFGEVQWEIP